MNSHILILNASSFNYMINNECIKGDPRSNMTDLRISRYFILYRIPPPPLFDMPAVNVLGNATTIEKYKVTLMNVLFSIRFQSGDNPAHQKQLKKTARKTRPNWNHFAWMSDIDVAKFDDLLAAYDWFLFLKETDDQPLRFGTVTTQWKDMGGFQDFCFFSELFPGDPTRPVHWVQNPVVADSILKMHLITSDIGNV